MAIKRTQYGWYSDVLGRAESSREAAEHYENIELQRRRAKTEADPHGNLSSEQLRELADKQLREENWQAISSDVLARIDAVLANYPWYKDNDKNGQIIMAKLSSPEAIGERRKQKRFDNDYSLLEIATAVEEAAEAGQLDLNEHAIRQQRAEAYSKELQGLMARGGGE